MPTNAQPDPFRRLPTPDEGWSDADDGTMALADEGSDGELEWPVEGIMGEEVDLDGAIRYEVSWSNWMRPSDGSNTTWTSSSPQNDPVVQDLIRAWQRTQVRRRQRLARAEPTTMPVPDTLTVHLWRTELRAWAFEEKTARARVEEVDEPGECSAEGWDDEVERAQQAPGECEDDSDSESEAEKGGSSASSAGEPRPRTRAQARAKEKARESVRMSSPEV